MRRAALAFAMAALLAGCVEPGALRNSPVPDARPSQPPPQERSSESADIETFYSRVERRLLTQGLLRTDGGGPDVPFTDEMLARNFLALAFTEEYSDIGGRVTARPRASTLHRWDGPVRITPVFGATVPDEVVAADSVFVDGYARRLSRATGHPVTTASSGGNFTLFVLHDQDLRRIGPRLKARLPEISQSEIAFVEALPLDAYCIVFTSDPDNSGRIAAAVAIVRAELPDPLRQSCYHEELAQGLGIANDSDLARPSIFKDDDEFGRLTTHDEYVLRLLYDPRLTPGMSEAEAAPLVREAARAMMAPAI
ncbi:DUF2927 domain-containing protein [Alphaproteobacteria bacterium GH1-50]|uniref:DUF2927 domain-containing protein n=1 Tax=Kangsaoukella pontilimi TaxID=2691042 RepID=A0A7C9IM58_9RHOB|nr:DUF2927 domain-containing protein [Kangsaoukella pontilimi]MXQ06470.1 DUF2927 domain-containing protein [Kangsaoukella pontilimi]